MSKFSLSRSLASPEGRADAVLASCSGHRLKEVKSHGLNRQVSRLLLGGNRCDKSVTLFFDGQLHVFVTHKRSFQPASLIRDLSFDDALGSSSIPSTGFPCRQGQLQYEVVFGPATCQRVD